MPAIKEVSIIPGRTMLDGKTISNADIQSLYREYCGDYPKFFKMDKLSQLGFIGAELLLKGFPANDKESISVILFNRNGSLITDRKYQETIRNDEYFPSPAVFVYTLANIVTGEIAIRHKIYGETSFYVLLEYDKGIMEDVVESAFLMNPSRYILTGWLEYESESNYLAEMKLVVKQ